jgi:hypothetical protein
MGVSEGIGLLVGSSLRILYNPNDIEVMRDVFYHIPTLYNSVIYGWASGGMRLLEDPPIPVRLYNRLRLVCVT